MPKAEISVADDRSQIRIEAGRAAFNPAAEALQEKGDTQDERGGGTYLEKGEGALFSFIVKTDSSHSWMPLAPAGSSSDVALTRARQPRDVNQGSGTIYAA